LNQNSQNSNKPPSSDGLTKKTTQPAIPKEKGKWSGGQHGHTGNTLKMVEVADLKIVHHAPCCWLLYVFKITMFELKFRVKAIKIIVLLHPHATPLLA
jgi:hypothetical protein